MLFGALLRLEKAIPLEAALLPILPRPFSARSSAGAITSVCSSSEAVLADWLPDLDPFDLDPLDEREPAAERCSFLSSSELDARDDAREEACSSLSSSLSDDATTRNRPARLEGSPPFFFSSWRRAHALCASFSSAWSRAACMRRRAVAPIRRSPTPPSSTACRCARGEIGMRWRGDGGEMEGRWRGDGGEMEGRWKGDGGEIEGRWRADGGRMEGRVED